MRNRKMKKPSGNGRQGRREKQDDTVVGWTDLLGGR